MSGTWGLKKESVCGAKEGFRKCKEDKGIYIPGCRRKHWSREWNQQREDLPVRLRERGRLNIVVA